MEPQNNIIEPTNRSHRIIFTTLIILLTAGVIGGSTYYVMGKNAKKDKEASEKASAELQKQIDEMKKTKTESTENTTAATAAKDETADWKTYINSKYGFSFKYPEEAKEGSGNEISFNVRVNDLIYMQDMPLGYDKENLIKDRTALSKNDPSVSLGSPVKGSNKMISIVGGLAKEETILRELEVCNVQLVKKAIIYKDNYQIDITWSYGSIANIEKNNPKYFTTDSSNCGQDKVWKDETNFYTDIVSGRTDSISQNWNHTFNQMISTFKFN